MTRTEARIDHVVAPLEPTAAEATRHRLHGLRTDCGCREGALLMVTALIGAIVYLNLETQPRSDSAIALILVGVLFGGAAVGKAIGLAIARARLLFALARLERGRQL
jgi:hypothetical protein